MGALKDGGQPVDSANPWEQLGKASGWTHKAPSVPPRGDLPHTLSFTRYAHGEIRVSIYPSRLHTRPARARTMAASQVRDALAASAGAVGEAQTRRAWGGKNLVQYEKFQDAIKDVSGYGGLPTHKIFSRRARRSIQEWGAIAWRKFGESGIFLTGTVPGTGALIAETVARYSGWLLNRVKQWFRDAFKSDYSVSAVWELQKRGMLHLHLCVCSNARAVLSRFIDVWKERWNALLIELSELTKVDLFRKNKYWSWQEDLKATRQDAQWLKYNPARYLAKYLSKGSRQAASDFEYHPSRWWSVDRQTASEARSERIRILLGGTNLDELKTFAASWFEDLVSNFNKIYPFDNPQFPGCGGVIAFADIADSISLSKYFEYCVIRNFDNLEIAS